MTDIFTNPYFIPSSEEDINIGDSVHPTGAANSMALAVIYNSGKKIIANPGQLPEVILASKLNRKDRRRLKPLGTIVQLDKGNKQGDMVVWVKGVWDD